MALVNIQNVTLKFGDAPLLEEINLTIEQGERAAVVGRNGSGKSTLLKLIAGIVRPGSGIISLQKGIRVAYLDQTVPGDIPGTVYEVVESGLARTNIQTEIQSESQRHQQVEKTISQLGLESGRVFNSLSAGLKRQTLLAQALVTEPDVLLLDEPTNHVDIDSVKRLEELLAKFRGSILFVTHDRMFLQRIATRIIEIDRGKLFDQYCDYNTFLTRRDAIREIEEKQNGLFDKKLEKEENWRRKGVRARGTRNEGRVRSLEQMREVRRERRDRTGIIKIEAQEAERSGALVVKATDISFSYGSTTVIKQLTATIMKGDRVGIIGPNGSGKTTLLRLLLGELQPTSGSIRLGTNLQICYFDQLREQLDESKTVQENVIEDGDTVTINGKTRHIVGYLQDFLFSPNQIRDKVALLSGGERNRLLLARLFTRPFNLLVLDEPTNDLDLETLELLEDYLMTYSGTLLMASHDRAFINNVVTSTLVFEGKGVVREYVGGYDDWVRQRSSEVKSSETENIKKSISNNPPNKPKLKFSFRQQKELEDLHLQIQELEKEQTELFHAMGEPDFYKKDKADIVNTKERLEQVKIQLDQAFSRWEMLETLKASCENIK